MQITWSDYIGSEYTSIVESWMDEDASYFTGCDDGWAAYVNYYINEDEESRLGENFWCKVIFIDGKPTAAAALFLTDECELCISEFVVAPDMRGKGYGSAILHELLENSENIIGKSFTKARAAIFPDNPASQKAFVNAGFKFLSVHPDGDIWNYIYEKEK